MDEAQTTSLYGKHLGILGRDRGSNGGRSNPKFFCIRRVYHTRTLMARIWGAYDTRASSSSSATRKKGLLHLLLADFFAPLPSISRQEVSEILKNTLPTTN